MKTKYILALIFLLLVAGLIPFILSMGKTNSLSQQSYDNIQVVKTTQNGVTGFSIESMIMRPGEQGQLVLAVKGDKEPLMHTFQIQCECKGIAISSGVGIGTLQGRFEATRSITNLKTFPVVVESNENAQPGTQTVTFIVTGEETKEISFDVTIV